MSFTPLGNRVLIEREEQTNQTASGLYIPDSAKEKPLQGKAVAVGKDAIEAVLTKVICLCFQNMVEQNLPLKEQSI